MQWPERPTCHDEDRQARRFRQRWDWDRRPADERWPQGIPYRTCSYCGSIHPEDLLAALAAGAELHGADWKLGWPHKFYIENIPNPNRDALAEVGMKSYPGPDGERVHESIYGAQGNFNSKWYNVHLMDQGYDEEALSVLMQRLSVASGIAWGIDGGELSYKAPHFGYQR
jgi:hypothetical protein